MQQFPFAHILEMTYRLPTACWKSGHKSRISAIEPMPVAIGFHPYFQLTDSTREDWVLSIGAKAHWLLADNKIPTGETEPPTSSSPIRKAVPLKDFDLDHVFGDLERDAQGRAVMSVKGKTQQLDVLLGPNYRSIVLYSPNPANARGGGGRGDVEVRRRLRPPRRRANAGCAADGRQRNRRQPRLHRHRADGRHHRFDEPRAQGTLQGAAEHSARRQVGRELLAQANRFLAGRSSTKTRSVLSVRSVALIDVALRQDLPIARAGVIVGDYCRLPGGAAHPA